MPSSSRRRTRSSRICAWMVTSSAVVGSSAIKSLGWQASAIAIMTRWRRPPESSCGYCAKRRSGAPIPTMRSSSSTRARIAAPPMLRCRRSVSPIWKPTGKVGFRLVIGSWKIMPMRLPRTSRIARSSRVSRSWSSSASRLPSICAGGQGRSRMMARAVTLLPQPNSPTSPTIRPASTVKDRSSTTRARPRSV